MDPRQGRTIIYLIIIGGCAELYSVRRVVGIWYVLEVLRRCDTLKRGAGGIIAACVGLVSAAVECDKSQEKRLQSPVRGFTALAVYNHGWYKKPL